MKKLHLFLPFLLLVLFVSQTGITQVISYPDSWGKQGITLQKQIKGGVEVNYSITEFSFEDLDIDGEQLKTINVPGIFLPNNEGAPDLPGTGKYIIIPQGSEASLKVIATRTETITDVEIAPAPRIPLDTEDGPLHYEKDMKIYSKDEYYPKEPVIISEKTNVRGVDVVMLGITPFQYNPVSKELIIYRDIQVEITYTDGNGYFGENRLRSRWWDPIIKNAVLNYESLPEIDFNKPYNNNSKSPDYEYLIITLNDPAFLSWADSIKLFRNLQGIKTGVVTTTDVGGNTVTAIENYVDNAYNTWDVPPSAVLLLADYSTGASGITSQTYAHPAPYPDFVSDNRFADVTGNDLPDIAFARITANDASQLEVMITKFLEYERNPPTSPDFYDHPITALGWQTTRWFQICSEVVGGYLKNVHGKNPVRINAVYDGNPTVDPWSTATNTSTVINYFGPSGLGYIPATPQELGGFSGGTGSDVIDAINSGSFMLQHRDHGSYTGWGEPAFNSTSINSLTNVNNKLPYIFSINCQTGAFHRATECFAEKFHRHTSGGQNSGALGIIAATEVSYSFVNDTYMWGVMDNMFPDFMPAETTTFPVNYVMPAFGNAAGKHFLYQSSWPYNTGDKLITYRLFHHHGGAFLTLYTEVPQYLTVVHDPVLIAGATTFSVTANAGTLIALTVNGEIIGTTDGTGSAVAITIPAQSPGNVMVVTVTKQNYYRYSANVNIVAGGVYADFSADNTNPCTGGSVTFTDLSFGTIISWNWSFPGGTPNSYNGQNPPAITYNTAGTYDVSLTISDGTDNDTETKTDYITVTDVVADFSGTPTTVIAGNTVTFTDNSSCVPTTWNWTFPGGTPGTATGPGPHTITYNTGGTYDVTLFISNGSNNDTETKNDYIEVIDCYTVTLPWTEDFEDVGPTINFTANEPNINGSCKWSYEKTANGRLQFNAYYHNGLQGAAVDCTPNGTISINHLTATLNLINYASSSDLELSFWHRNYSEESNANDRVWIRGSDSDTWIEIYNLYDDDANSNWVEVTGLDIDAEISANGQSITSTFQLRFGQEDNYSFITDGRVFDDISITGAASGLWTGTTSTDWGTTTNWDDSNIPVAGIDVTIPTSPTGGNYPETNSGAGAECNNLMIESGAHLYVPSNNILTVNGTLTNNTGVSGLVIKSTANDETGSLIHTTNGVDATVERYLTEMKWHFVSPPISDAKLGVFHLPGGHSDIFCKRWDEPTEQWVYMWTPLTTPLNVEQGYGIWVANNGTGQDETIEFEGTLNNNVTAAYTLTNTTGNTNMGWNWIGNPYPSALDWDMIPLVNKVNMDNTIYYWNPATGLGNYSYYVGSGTAPWTGTPVPVNDGSRYIPAMQGFNVHCNVSGSTGSIKLDNTARVHNSQAFYKNTENYTDFLRLKAVGNGYRDETVIRFFEGATEGFDSDFDAYKLFGLIEAPQLYSIIPGEVLSVNSLSGFDEYRIVDLGFECGVPEIFTIEASEIESFEKSITIYLEDIKEGTLHNLSNNPSYAFTHEVGDNPNRFLLHFGEPSSTDEVNNQQAVRIYSNEDVVYVQQPAGMQGEIIIYDMVGREILRQETGDETLSLIKVTNGTGYYLVKVQTEEFLVVEKVFIR